ncbi:leucine rich repeat family protein [Ophiostoma piceae UAMH 11346]|uniref:Leucine rich repeat family protein n=1 Tax=Ophiostoma piceae (strain UAMH 11346) TaxID=1262450 RepID=S3C6K6_OPHP1|nr:leucine rich repeat family protein [Ophiostoma piceae UAMH 11346]
MSDEPTLPRFPHSKAADAFFGPSRKRVRPDIFDGNNGSSAVGTHHLMLNNSSDPAVFSSDDDPALDNYAPDPATGGHTRKKKRYVGAWFSQHPASADSTFDGGERGGHGDEEELDQGLPQATTRSPVRFRHSTLPLISSPLRPQPNKRRTFERQFDSGVFMDKDSASNVGDESIDRDEDELARIAMESSPPPPSQASSSSQLSLAPPPLPPTESDFPPPPPRQRRVFHRVSSLAVSPAERKARCIVQDCIEAGNEGVELIGLGLGSLSNATIEPLAGLVPIPVVTENVAFEQKDPELKLFLSNNYLLRLPGALFNIEHLTVLSLRRNRLTELPPAIGKLKNLKSLNVSLNALRYLPAELLPLIHVTGKGGKLTELLVHPNRFFEFKGQDELDRRGKYIEKLGHRQSCVARSPVCYKDSYGKVWSDFSMQPEPSTPGTDGASNVLAIDDASVAPTPPWSTLPHLARGDNASSSTVGLTASRVPTLVEKALEACYRAPQLPHLADMLPDDAPLHVRRQLDKAVELRESGGCTCCVCGKRETPLIAPMTEWIEWWEFGKSEINISIFWREYAESHGEAVDPSYSDNDSINIRHPSKEKTTDQIEVLPFAFRGCSWGCVPTTTSSS